MTDVGEHGQIEAISLERVRKSIKNLSYGNQSLGRDLNWELHECYARGAVAQL